MSESMPTGPAQLNALCGLNFLLQLACFPKRHVITCKRVGRYAGQEMDYQLPTAAPAMGAGPAAGAAQLGCFPVPFFFCPPAGDAMVYPMLFPPAGPCFLPPQAMAPLGPYTSPPYFFAAMGAMAAAAAAAAAPGAWAPPPQALPPPRACESSASFSPAKARHVLQPQSGAAQARHHHHHHLYRRDYNCSRTSLAPSSRSRQACATQQMQVQPAAAGGDAPAIAAGAPAQAAAAAAVAKAPQQLGNMRESAAAPHVMCQQAAASGAAREKHDIVASAGAVSLGTESHHSAASGAAVDFTAEQPQPPLMQQPFRSPFLTAPQMQLSYFQAGAAAQPAATESHTAASPAPRSKPNRQAMDTAAHTRRSTSDTGTAVAEAPAGGAAEGRVALEPQDGGGGEVWVDSRRVRAVLRRRQQRGRTVAADLGVAIAPGGLKVSCVPLLAVCHPGKAKK